MISYEELDVLNRKEQIKDIKNIISNYTADKKSLTLAINGSWGCGKTFFLKELMEECEKDTFVFYYDAWSNNYYEEPLIGLLDVIRKQLNEINKNSNMISTVVLEVLNIITNFFDTMLELQIGFKPIKKISDVKKYINKKKKESLMSDEFNPYVLIDNAKATIVNALSKLEEKGNKVLILIDELDRCDPRYSIKVLERIHHLSSNVNLCVLVAIDMEQMEKSINSIYSFTDEKMSKKYLRKIVNMTYDIGNGEFDPDKRKDIFGELEKLFSDCINESKINSQVSDFEYILFHELEIRKIQRLVDFTTASHKLIFNGEKCSPVIMCGELLIGWAILHFKNNESILNDLAKEYDNNNKCLIYDFIRKNLTGYINSEQSAWGHPSLFISDVCSYLYYLIKVVNRENIRCTFQMSNNLDFIKHNAKIVDGYLNLIEKTAI